jgi:ACS family tartrate transporter-like MFS transporter
MPDKVSDRKLQQPDCELVVRKILWHVLPFLFLLYVVAYLDRVNISFGALQMRQQLGFSDETYGLGAGLFFAGYLIFQVPSNLVLQRVGASRWISLLMIVWGVISSSMMFINTAERLYVLRFLLGAAEAGFFPGILFYFRAWIPAEARARVIAMFLTAGPVSGIIGGPISGALLGLHGILGLAGWQWLFLVEGIPAIFLGAAALCLILDRPENAKWLNRSERNWLVSKLAEQDRPGAANSLTLPDRKAAPKLFSDSSTKLKDFNVVVEPHIWAFAFVYFSLNTCAYGITLWLPIVLRSVSGVSNFVLGLLSTIPYLAAVVLMVAFGRHSDRTGDRRWHTAGAACFSACALFAAGYSHSTAALIGAFTLAMVGVQSMAGTFWAMSSGGLSGSAAAVGIAFINSLGNLGSGFGPYWIGRMRTATGEFREGLWSISAILAVAAIVTSLVPLSCSASKRGLS